MKVSVLLGEKKADRKAEIAELLERSHCVVARVKDPLGGLKQLVIQIRGPLADIPAAKNRKMVTKFGVFNNRKTDIFLRALTELVGRELFSTDTFGDAQVSVVVACAKRKRSFDTDNVYTTVRDFLEPATKVRGAHGNHKRGWGIGVIEDDAQVGGGGWHAKQLGALDEITSINIRKVDGEVTGKLKELFLLHQIYA